MDDKIIANMRTRVERCRRLARDCSDEQTAKVLLEMANEGELDIARLIAERNEEPPTT